MKHTIAIAIMSLMIAVTVRGETNDWTDTQNHTYTNTYNLIIGTSPPPVAVSGDATVTPHSNKRIITATEEIIQRMAASGEICKALGGHFWRHGRPGEGEGSSCGGWYADYHPGTTYRTCAVCGKCESKSEGNWK